MEDKKALLEFLEKQGGDLMSFALSLLNNWADAEDACQETIVQLLKHWDNFDRNKNLKGWALTILYHKCLDQLKKRRRFGQFFKRAAEAYRPTEEEPSDEYINRSWQESIFNQLKPKERACLLLWGKEGYRAEEIAGILGCATGTVRVHLFQARKKLKKLMEKGNE
ncbi:MAG: RNA polymerase sigma factor [Candidatus Saccharicenans sp.]|jgi:RNA polymerase sigma-70 factor (ECF subfamily)|nr:RNA polymerase sigma factor [Candidatus Saccharicenans sp.]